MQAYDRYAYVNNNPIRYTDPSGHCVSDPFSFFICAMVAGAAIDAGINAYSQYQETGQIDAREVFDHAVEGAVIGGGVVIAVVAAVALIPAGSVVASAACADGDCTNEVAAIGGEFSGTVIRGGPINPMNLTPRPTDTTGLSTFTSPEKLVAEYTRLGQNIPSKYMTLDTSKLAGTDLKAILDNPETGHVTISAASRLIVEWSSTRASLTPATSWELTHKFTQLLEKIIVGPPGTFPK